MDLSAISVPPFVVPWCDSKYQSRFIFSSVSMLLSFRCVSEMMIISGRLPRLSLCWVNSANLLKIVCY